jgi:hypothetical protein
MKTLVAASKERFLTYAGAKQMVFASETHKTEGTLYL